MCFFLFQIVQWFAQKSKKWTPATRSCTPLALPALRNFGTNWQPIIGLPDIARNLDQLQGGVQVPKPFYVAILFLLGQMNANDRPVQKWKDWRAGDMLHPEGKHRYHQISIIIYPIYPCSPCTCWAEERPVERQNPRRWLLSRPSCVHEEMGDQCGGPLQWIAVCGHLGMAQSWVPQIRS